jgi:flagellar hook-associated protein 3 FlgL
MKITNTMLYDQVNADISRNSEILFKLNGQISSAKRINTPSDDPIGLASVLGYRSDLNSFAQFGKAIDFSTGWNNNMDSILQDTDNLLARASELAVQQASSTATAATRTGAAEEVKQLREEMLSNANAKYGNKYVFSGTRTQTQPFLDVDVSKWQDDVATMSTTAPASPVDGARYISTAAGATQNHIFQYSTTSSSWVDQGAPAEGDAVVVSDRNTMYVFNGGEWKNVYQGNDSTFSVQIGRGTTAQTNIPGNDVFTNQQGNVYMSLLNLEKALRDNDVDGIKTSLSDINASATVISNNLASVGAIVNKLTHTKTVLSSSTLNTKSSMSNIEDLDYAAAILELQNQQTIYQATLKSATMITGLSLVDYI